MDAHLITDILLYYSSTPHAASLHKDPECKRGVNQRSLQQGVVPLVVSHSTSTLKEKRRKCSRGGVIVE